ncbi:MAG: hypothetical protein AB7P24_06525 [Nitrospira sp.]
MSRHKSSHTIIPVRMGLAALVSLSFVGEVQSQHGHPTAKGRSSVQSQLDERVPLAIGSAAEAGLKLTMREHLEAIHGIVAALGRQDFEQAAKVAHDELGFLKHHQAMQREGGATFPSKYHELAMAHHQAAEDLAKVIPSRDLRIILSQLDRTIEACVACHRAYQL